MSLNLSIDEFDFRLTRLEFTHKNKQLFPNLQIPVKDLSDLNVLNVLNDLKRRNRFP